MSASARLSTSTVRISVPARSRDGKAPPTRASHPPPASTPELAAPDSVSPENVPQDLLETIYDALVIANQEGTILAVNARAAELFRTSVDALLKQRVSAIIDGAGTELLQELSRLTGRQPFAVLDAFGLRADGTDFAAEIAVHATQHDARLRLVFFVRDITRRIQTEKELVRLGKAAASASDAIAITDEAGAHIYQNPAFLDLIGPAARASLPERRGFAWLIGEAAPAAEYCLQEGISWSGRVDIADPLRGPVPTLFRVDPIRQDDGRVLGTLAIVSDITKEQQAEQRLRQTLTELEHSNAELEQIAYVASHDLKEPLRVIAGYLTLLQRRYAAQLDATAQGYIRHAVEGAERLRDLINHILEYARLNRTPAPMTTSEAGHLVRLALDNLRNLVEERHALVTVDPLPLIHTSLTRVTQVFQNLIDNAIRYCDQPVPKVHIRALNRDPFWVFLVTDNGIGIPAELQNRVFLLFQRLHTKAEVQGLGIGLAACRKTIEYLGGSLWIEESTPGRGSTFAFSIPMCTGITRPPPAFPQTVPETPSRQPAP